MGQQAVANLHVHPDAEAIISSSPTYTPQPTQTDRTWITQGSYVVLDIETTGIQRNKAGTYLGTETNRTVQLAMQKVVNGQVVATWNSYFNPYCDVNGYAFKTHKLSRPFLETQPSFESRFDDIIKFLFNGSTCTMVAGHHVGTDIAILRYEFERVLSARQDNTEYQMIVADTLSMSRRDAKRRQGTIIDSPCKKIKKVSRLSCQALKERKTQQARARQNRQIAKEARLYREEHKAFYNIRTRSTPKARQQRAKKRSLNLHNLSKKSIILRSYPEGAIPFTLEAQAKHYTHTTSAAQAAKQAMANSGLDALAIQKKVGVPKRRRMKSHEATTDVMMTCGLLQELGKTGDYAPYNMATSDENTPPGFVSDPDSDDSLTSSSPPSSPASYFHFDF